LRAAVLLAVRVLVRVGVKFGCAEERDPSIVCFSFTYPGTNIS